MALDLDQLDYLVVQWAHKQNLVEGSDLKSQFAKLIEEAGELSKSINKKRDIRDDIGDCFVVLSIMAAQKGHTMTECVEIAYNDIKDREGRMFDGVFVKSTDLHYASVVAELEARKAASTVSVDILSKD